MNANEPKKKKRTTFFVWLLLVISFFALFMVHSWNEPQEHASFETFLEHIDEGRVASIRINDNQIFVQLNDGAPDYLTLGVVDDELTQYLSDQGARVGWGKPSQPWVTTLMIALPLLLVLVFLWYFARKAGSTDKGMFTLGKSRARLITDIDVTFDDVGGCEDAKRQLGDVIDFLKHPQRWTSAGARLPRGVLLEGPPGCGKTLLARAVAGETDAKFYSVAASEFVELFVGTGAARVRDMFQTAAKNPPAVIFIDEIDAVGRRRGSGLGLANDEREQTLNQLLVSLDGFEKDEQVAVIAATNRSDILDPALLRSGRFDRRIEVPLLPDESRLEVLRIHTRNKPLDPELRLNDLVDRTAGFTGAQLESLANEATLLAVRRARLSNHERVEITMDDFIEGIPRQARETGLGYLDALLVESVAHLARPRGKVEGRIELQDGSELVGELIWADAAFIKLRTATDNDEVLIPKGRVRRVQSLSAPEIAPIPDAQASGWTQQVPELV